jgi:hypothetical protein
MVGLKAGSSTGVAVGPHSTFGHMLAIEFAASFEDDAAAAVRRQKGPCFTIENG